MATRGSFNEALGYYTSALKLFEELGIKQGISWSHNNMAGIYSEQGNNAKAIESYTKILRTYEEAGDKSGIGDCWINIGTIYFEQDDYDKALECFTKALKLKTEVVDQRGMATSLNNLGNVYGDQGFHDNAIDYYNKSLNKYEELGDKHGMSYALSNLGVSHRNIGKYSEALDLLARSLEIREALNEQKGIAISLNAIGTVHEKLGEYDKAIAYGSRALAIAQEIDDATLIEDASYALWTAYRSTGHYQDALIMHELYLQTKDSLESEQNRKGIIRQEFKYEYEKQAAADSIKAVAAVKLKNEEIRRAKLARNGFLGGFVLVALFAGVFFVQRKRISKEKERSEDLLLNILPEEVALELKDKGQAEAKAIDEATVLFTDFKGFTALSEQLSPKELVADIHECFSAFDKIMEKHGLEKIKTIGDAYMAAGGLPVINKTHAGDVVKAALEIRDFMDKERSIKTELGVPYFEIRIGIHTGPVVAGIVGIKKFQYDIWGDTVNTASRMESSGEVGKVNISETTYALINDQFNCEYRGEIEAKGKGKLKMYFVEA